MPKGQRKECGINREKAMEGGREKICRHETGVRSGRQQMRGGSGLMMMIQAKTEITPSGSQLRGADAGTKDGGCF